MASVWQRLSDIVGSVNQRTGVAGSLANLLDPDTWLPGGKDAAFTLALIALSAKMAMSDGVVTASEVRFFARSPDTLEHVLDGLFHIASADGMIHEDELEYLKNVSDIFGFDDARFEQIAAQHVVLESGADPYRVLGLMPGADKAEVKRVYRLLVAEHHPDRLIAKGVPEELIDIATARMQAINEAYDKITRLPAPKQLGGANA